MPLSTPSTAVASFLRAVRKKDPAAMVSELHQDAVLVDADREYRAAAIRGWAERLFQAGPLTVRYISRDSRQDEMVVTIAVGGGITPASGAQFDWRFKTADDCIVEVRIETHEGSALPAPVAAFVDATNGHDQEGLLSTFAEHALVNDQLRDYWGRQAVFDWAIQDIIGENLTMEIVECVRHYENVVFTAAVDGDFDKRGLPDPLVLSFYFTVVGDKIVQLIILRNKSGT
jgi:ketosteroid isomerase-like protein